MPNRILSCNELANQMKTIEPELMAFTTRVIELGIRYDDISSWFQTEYWNQEYWAKMLERTMRTPMLTLFSSKKVLAKTASNFAERAFDMAPKLRIDNKVLQSRLCQKAAHILNDIAIELEQSCKT